MRWPSFALVFIAVALATQVAAQNSESARSYRIGPRDQIQIHVDEAEEISREVTVAEDGTISLPRVGTLEVRGLTETQLATRLRSRLLERGMRDATVTISVTNFRSRPVSILGAVGEPGNHFVPGTASLLEVLSEAGGLKDTSGTEIVVRRRADNGLSDEIRIPVKELLESGNPRVNIPIFAGDLINVPPARAVEVHLLGEVNQPGRHTFESGQRVTLLTVLAAAGGLTENASRNIRIQRVTSSGERMEIEADFRRILNNKDPDIPIEDGDLVIVKESFF